MLFSSNVLKVGKPHCSLVLGGSKLVENEVMDVIAVVFHSALFLVVTVLR